MELRMQYATTADGVRIAYGTAGSGPWIVRVPSLPFTHSQLEWEQGSEFFDMLAANWTVAQYDPRGCGLSDRESVDLSMEARMLDLEAVVDKLGLEKFALHGIGWAGPLVITYAVRHPERVSYLVLDDSQARIADFMNIPQMRALDQLTDEWDSFLDYLVFMTFGKSRDEAAPHKAFLQACVTPDGARRMFTALRSDDARDLLAQVTQPTLIVQHTGMSRHNVDNAREMAAGISDAHMLLLEGSALDENERIVRGIADLMGFPAVVPSPHQPHTHSHEQSGVRTILFTDMVEHTSMMSRLGDDAGREVLKLHESITRGVLHTHGGAEIKSRGDGFMASFASVSSAVECAIALQKAFAELEGQGREPLRVRIGLTAGEPIEDGGDLFGAAVIMASRIAAHGGAGEILTSGVVRELCAGKGFLFADRGENVLRGFEDPVRVYEVSWRS
jgi:class 3 adenylate cyclase/pimeloyl-ACP methyl ester carboxylesterase